MEGIMKSIKFFFLTAILLGFGCELSAAETPANNIESEHDALLAVDKAWSETVEDINAFLS